MKNKLSKLDRGFTLIEMMISLAIFTVVSAAAVSIFVTAVKSQRRGFLEQNTQDNARYLMEYMIKEIRMSKIKSNSTNPGQPGGDKSLQIVNQYNHCTEYKFKDSDKSIERQEYTIDTCTGAPPGYDAINSSNIKVEGAFYIFNETNQQSRVTIKMRVYSPDAGVPEVKLQNTVSLRRYES